MNIQPVRLEGSIVCLEPLSLAHLDGLSQVAFEQELWELAPSALHSKADLQAYIESALQLQREGKALPFATIERASGCPIGSSRFGNIDTANRRVEIGWTWIARPWRRTLVNTEAKYLMLQHAFESLGCARVEFKTDVLNERSRRALLRIGAKEEGIFRSHMIVQNGRIRDSVYYSIIAPEWPEVKIRLKEKLQRPDSRTPPGR
ncbi:MAG TPA: GNAT family protein [Bacteroidota bacterium]|nr:GNAT family protein [Bacteroidota bacterium]